MLRFDGAKDWSNKNELTIFDYANQSGKKVWWECHKCRCEWEHTVVGRTMRNNKCPECSSTVNHWSDSEIEILKNTYPDNSAKYCWNKLGRTKESVLSKIYELGLKRYFRK